jgi:hypothetical protein
MRLWFAAVLAACKHAPEEPPPPRMSIVGKASHRCGDELRPVREREVILSENASELARTLTDAMGRFSIDLDLAAEEGRFTLAIDEGLVRIVGSTRLRYRVSVVLPCDDEDRQVGPERVLSDVWPEDPRDPVSVPEADPERPRR